VILSKPVAFCAAGSGGLSAFGTPRFLPTAGFLFPQTSVLFGLGRSAQFQRRGKIGGPRMRRRGVGRSLRKVSEIGRAKFPLFLDKNRRKWYNDDVFL